MTLFRSGLIALVAVFALSLPGQAQDNLEMGKMWTFEHVPKDYFQKNHGFELTQDWLDHVRMASLRFGGGCSGSFVSPDGLVMTNHHCARDFIADASPKDQDWVRDGFVAKNRDEEVQLDGCTVQQLVAVRDITALINAGINPDDDARTVTQKRNDNQNKILADARKADGSVVPEVIKLYQGGVFMLYSYKIYTDVRLVVAPHLQTAHFGGDPDNFTYPRFGIDFTFCRAYEDGKPADTSKFHFGWDSEGAEKGESIFVTGNPGRTSRLMTRSQLEVLRDVTYPILLENWAAEMDDIKARSKADPKVEKELRPRLLRLENSNKAVGGYLSGLRDASLMRAKAGAETKLRDAVDASPELADKFGDAWDKLSDISSELRRCEPTLRLYTPDIVGPTVQRAILARRLSGDAERDAAIMAQIMSIPTTSSREGRRFALRRLTSLRDWLGKADPLVSAIMKHGDLGDALDTLASQSLFADDEKTKALLEGGPEAVAKSDDPALAIAAIHSSERATARSAYQKLKRDEEVQKVRVGQAAFAVYGFSISPDATYSLRLSDGKVQGYEYNGTIAPHQTVFYGLYARNTEFDNVYPFNLPDIWRERAYRIDMTKPVNFVGTNDIIGGNSGSPVIDKNKNVVGLIFDGNIEMLPNNFFYRDEVPRSVSVHTAAIEECLVKIYEAKWVLEELKGR